MRSFAVKLTIAFLFVGITGALLVALITDQRMRQEFDRFVRSREQVMLVDALGDYYALQGSWAGVEQLVGRDRLGDHNRPQFTVVDTNERVVFSADPTRLGRRFDPKPLDIALPIDVGDQQVGVVFIDGRSLQTAQSSRLTAELLFLRNVNSATIVSAVIASVIALVLGVIFARTLVRPVRELTEATRLVAGGALGHQVTIRSRDEIGELAVSFNKMSTDLAHASQTRKQMTADIAHDLRTPLSILRGYTEGLKDGALDGAPKLYAIMHEEVVHLQHLVEDLRTLSLADAGEISLHRRSVDPKALLERSGLAYVMQAEQQGISLRIDAPDGLPSVAVDIERMTQVLNNLVANALRFTSQGEIVLSASADASRLRLCVRDTGAGIPADDLPYVFDRFYRVDKARQRSDNGESGLGLAIAKALVEVHGGSIAVESTIGQGTTFTISLPLAAHTPA